MGFPDGAADKATGKAPPGLSALLLALARVIAQLLQSVVLSLEKAIEFLGYEPERRWEAMSFAAGMPGRRPSPDTLLKRAKALAERGEAEGALKLYVKVLEIEPDNTEVMDLASEVLAELGDGEGARELIQRSIQLAPTRGYNKYVLLGHIEHGEKAVEAFEKGLELLTFEVNRLKDADREGGGDAQDLVRRKKALHRKMANVLAAIAKVYLTDCFLEKGAMRICERLLDRALVLDADSPEACQALADLRMSQGRRGEALVLVRRTVDVCKALPAGVAPSYDFRAVTSRLLVELSQYELAADVLEELTDEDDEDTEVWYLLGLVYMFLGDLKACRESLQKARALLEATRGSGNAALLEQINALAARRSIGEDEKETFWNPRWWLRSEDGTGPSSAGGGSRGGSVQATLSHSGGSRSMEDVMGGGGGGGLGGTKSLDAGGAGGAESYVSMGTPPDSGGGLGRTISEPRMPLPV